MKELKELRKFAGLTQQQLASAIGGSITAGYLSKVESGKLVPTLRNIRKIANACGFDVEIKFVKKF